MPGRDPPVVHDAVVEEGPHHRHQHPELGQEHPPPAYFGELRPFKPRMKSIAERM
jgi:hypothetical protein